MRPHRLRGVAEADGFAAGAKMARRRQAPLRLSGLGRKWKPAGASTDRPLTAWRRFCARGPRSAKPSMDKSALSGRLGCAQPVRRLPAPVEKGLTSPAREAGFERSVMKVLLTVSALAVALAAAPAAATPAGRFLRRPCHSARTRRFRQALWRDHGGDHDGWRHGRGHGLFRLYRRLRRRSDRAGPGARAVAVRRRRAGLRQCDVRAGGQTSSPEWPTDRS